MSSQRGQLEGASQGTAGFALKLTDLHHLAQLLQVARDQVEEGEPVEVLGALVAHLHNLVVPLQQSHLPQLLPAVLVVQSFGCLQSDLRGHRGRLGRGSCERRDPPLLAKVMPPPRIKKK